MEGKRRVLGADQPFGEGEGSAARLYIGQLLSVARGYWRPTWQKHAATWWQISPAELSHVPAAHG